MLPGAIPADGGVGLLNCDCRLTRGTLELVFEPELSERTGAAGVANDVKAVFGSWRVTRVFCSFWLIRLDPEEEIAE